MKKYIFMAAALMMMGMGMSSCSNEDVITEVEQTPMKVQLTLTATFDMGGETRATWGEDGITPKFANNEKVAVYSDNSASPEQLTVSVDEDGNATLTGEVTSASEYHLVFCKTGYTGTSYNSSTKQITGFFRFIRSTGSTYPVAALHYARLSSSETSVRFKPLCAILKGPYVSNASDRIFLNEALINNPVINITNEGAEVSATKETNTRIDISTYMISNEQAAGYIAYFPVAPGEVKLFKGSASGTTKTTTVEAGKIYTVAP